MKKIYIVILNFNGYEDTLILLKSLPRLKAEGYKIYTVIVDNGSTDESASRISAVSSQLKIDKIIRNKKNLGFARGINIGIKYVLDRDANYILLLNSDTIIKENFLPDLLSLDSDISAPLIQYKYDDKYIYDLGGKVNSWTGRTTHIETSDRSQISSLNISKIDFISGTAMLVKRRVFELIGLFNEKYFFYFEDVDFCIRAKKADFTMAVSPKHYIFHKLSSSIGRWSSRAIYYNLLGNFIFITKHLGWRRITGYAYLSVLTAKIIRDRLMVNIKKKLKVI